MSKATLFSLPGSHPARAAAMMLDFKGIEYRKVDLLPVAHKAIVRLAGFKGSTVPALKFNGEKVIGSIEIARALDRLVPEPPLLPGDEELRSEVLKAEAFGESELQDATRRILWNTVRRKPRSIATFLEGSTLPLPPKVAEFTSGPIILGEYRINDSGDENVIADLAALPGWLDRMDSWVEAGVLGGENPNAADFQVLTSVQLLMRLRDLRPHIETRPIGEAAKRLIPDYPGDVPPALPAEWLEPLAGSGQ
ncbi:MAG: glutathione S-transferase N-terminal domain-containing protein [Solirubrobacterales bacterium]|nr:glutathione S-transferase N-terminal domain-containing protein [Solirubrobacterales bacterium]